MKNLFGILLVSAMALKASGQGTVEAMLNYVPTAQSGGSPIYSSIYTDINGPVGWTFAPTEDISVTALGAFSYVVPSHGNLEVGLWNSAGTLLASQSVNSSSSSVDQSVYASIAPLLLAAGQTYYIAAYAPAGYIGAVVVTPDMPPNGYASMASEIQLGLVAYTSGTGFSFPSTTDGHSGYAIIAPNFEFQAVPEPCSEVLATAGLACLWWFRRSSKAA